MRGLKFILTLVSCVVMAVLVVLSGVYGQSSPTPDPIDATSTAFVVEATQNALLTGFTAQSAPSGGTATPVAGVCNTLTFRALSDVSMMLETFFQRAELMGLTLKSVDASAIEETTNCVDFGVRETAVDVVIEVENIDNLHDETALGQSLTEILSIVSQTVVTNLTEVRLKIAFTFGNQTRLFDVLIDGTFWADVQDVPADEMINWLTER